MSVPSLAARVSAGWRRIPPRIRRPVLIVTVGGVAFAATILPFVASDRATTSVEIAGRLPQSATVGTPVSFDIAADNRGDGTVHPLCIKVTTQPPAADLSAIFQGLDHVAGGADLVCGGLLSGSETVSVHLRFTPTRAGPTTLRLVAADGSREVGPARLGSVDVGAKSAS